MRDEIIEKMIEEAPDGTPRDSIKVPLDVEIKIMSEKLWRRGRSIHGVRVFPRMQIQVHLRPLQWFQVLS